MPKRRRDDRIEKGRCSEAQNLKTQEQRLLAVSLGLVLRRILSAHLGLCRPAATEDELDEVGKVDVLLRTNGINSDE